MIKVRYKKLASGKYSIYLDCYDETTKERQYEFLKLYVAQDYSQKQNIFPEDRPVMHAVRSILEEKAKNSTNNKKDIQEKETNTLLSFIEMLHQKEMAIYTKSLYKHLKNYLPAGKDPLISNIDLVWIERFSMYCKEKFSQTLATTLLLRLKTILNMAFKDGLVTNNSFDKFNLPSIPKVLPTYLTIEEIVKLEQFPVTFNPQIRDAFLFSLYAGLQWQDVTTFMWKTVSKTVQANHTIYSLTLCHRLDKTFYTIELNPKAAAILEKFAENQKPDGEKLVFDKLPNNTNCFTSLKLWGYQAGLNKNVNFSMARNTFIYQSLHKNKSIKEVCIELGLKKSRRMKLYLEELKNHDNNTLQAEPER